MTIKGGVIGRNTHDQDETDARRCRIVQCGYRNCSFGGADSANHSGPKCECGTGALGLRSLSLLVAAQLLRRLRLLPAPPLVWAASLPPTLVVICCNERAEKDSPPAMPEDSGRAAFVMSASEGRDVGFGPATDIALQKATSALPPIATSLKTHVCFDPKSGL
jgi:hypothetical protein